MLLGIALLFVTFSIYRQAGNHQFLNFDDNVYVTSNPNMAGGLTYKNIIWAFTSVEAYNWHPITRLSHLMDVQLYGMEPRGHHFTSVAIHSISTLLLFVLFFRLTGAVWQSSFVAALFALHPLHVESVAWVAERKDVLSALFCFLTLILYSGYVTKQRPALYFLALFSFILGLMSKPMLVSLPIIMLLLDLWPLGRFSIDGQEPPVDGWPGRLKPLIREKIPFVVLSVISAYITIFAQSKGGAVAGLNVVPFWLRIENALVSYAKYIGKTVYPHDLAVLYPFPSSIPLWQIISSLVILLALSAGVIRAGRSYPYLVVGWLWFLITLVPVIGLVQVGSQAMADRYSYIPLTGLFIMAAWGVPDMLEGVRYRQSLLNLLYIAVICIVAALTSKQLGHWKNNSTLYRHTLSVTDGNYTIHNNLGYELAKNGELDAAIREYRKAVEINPGYVDARNNLGLALAGKGGLAAAIVEYRKALLINPDDSKVRNNLGAAFQATGDFDAAIPEFQKAVTINPDYADAHYNLGTAFETIGNLDAAIKEYGETLRSAPHDAEARNRLELALARKRDSELSRKTFQ